MSEHSRQNSLPSLIGGPSSTQAPSRVNLPHNRGSTSSAIPGQGRGSFSSPSGSSSTLTGTTAFRPPRNPAQQAEAVRASPAQRRESLPFVIPGNGTPYSNDRRELPDVIRAGSGPFRSPQTPQQIFGTFPSQSQSSVTTAPFLPQQPPPPARPPPISTPYQPAPTRPMSQIQGNPDLRQSPLRMSHAALVRSPEKDDGEDYEVEEDGTADDGSLRSGKKAVSRKRTIGARDDEVDELEEDEDAASLLAADLTATGKKRRPHATRRRVVQSCSECRRRKIKCDKKVPCGPCVVRNDQSMCHEVGMAEKNINASPHTHATAAELALVAQRLDALEFSLTKTGALDPVMMDQYLRAANRSESVNGDAGPSGYGDQAGGSSRLRGMSIKEELQEIGEGSSRMTDAPLPPHLQGQGTEASTAINVDRDAVQVTRPAPTLPFHKRDDIIPPALDQARTKAAGKGKDPVDDSSTISDPDADPQDDTEGAALTLEHLAFGRSTAAGTHAIPHFGANRAQSAISKHAPNNDYHLARPHPVPLQGTPPGGSSQVKSGSGGNVKSNSAGNSPLSIELRRKSLHVQGSQGSTHSGHGILTTGTMGERSGSISGLGGNGKGKADSSFHEDLSPEDRAMRIDALLDLIGPMDVFQLFYRKTDVGLRALTKVLPDREIGELLVRTYLEKVDWLYRCLHIPTFLRQCNDLWALPQDMIVHDIALPFVALYFSVCCLGVQFMDTDEAKKHFTPEEIRDLPDLYFNAARSTMWAGDFVGQHSVENLQCLILLGVFMNNRDRGEAAWALLGAAIKMAQGLGLSRLGAESTSSGQAKSSPMWTGRWESVIEREVGRRIWWNLVFLDWALSPSYNFSCSIHPDQIKTDLPSNIEDEDLIDNQPLRPQPHSVRTGMSFVLARIKFIQIMYRQICEANLHRHTPYSFILSVDGELRKAMMDLPSFFQPKSSDKFGNQGTPPPEDHDPRSLVQHYEKVMLNLAIHSRMLRLHRPWLSRGYTDERFAYSKEQCIRAARATLRLMGDTHGTAAFLEKWWLPLFYVSVSGLVVIIDLLRTNRRDMHSSETEQKISEVRGALDQMKQIADVSHPSRSAVKVMEFLLAEVEERRRPPGSSAGKRKASDDGDDTDGLQRAVKKLIRQAQLEADSPTSSTNNFPPSTPSPASSYPHAGVSPHHDPARDRPVFDAYPLLPSAATLQQRSDPIGASSVMRGAGPIKGTTHTGSRLLDYSFDNNNNSKPSNSGNTNRQNINNITSSSNQQNPSSSTLSNHPISSLQGFIGNHDSQIQSQFAFPLDPDNPFSFPTYNPDPLTSGPQLDPSVETLLANYFPTPQQQLQNGNMNGGNNNGNGTAAGLGGAGSSGGGGGNNVNLMGQGQNQETWGTVPDDFLSRVFSFSWDTTPGAAAGGEGMQGYVGGQGMGSQGGQGVMQPPLQGGMGQGNRTGGNAEGTGPGQKGGWNAGAGAGGDMGGLQGSGQGGGMDFVPYDWGTSSGGWMA